MINKKIGLTIAGLLCIAFIIIANTLGYDTLAYIFELSILPAITILYLTTKKTKPLWLTLFFISYTLGEFVHMVDYFETSRTLYIVCNSLYILAYLFLIVEVGKAIKLHVILKNHLLDLTILVGLLIYMLYVLLKFIKPTDFETNYVASVQIIELFYNLVLLIIVAISFLNYIQNSTYKSLLLFFGCMSLALSELILIAYYYFTKDLWLSYLYTTLYITGFLLLYYQSFVEQKSKFIE